MDNPFNVILDELKDIKEKFLAINNSTNPPTIEIIDRDELCRRLSITEPTVIRYEKKKIIPAIRIGTSVRYNWPSVVASLEKNKA